MTDMLNRAPATSAMQKLLSFRGTDDLRELPFGMIRISNEAMMWLRGVRGELLMADRLRHLGPEWRVIHSVLVTPYSDIDHIAIGPPGVFPINTKRLIDREIVVDGDVFRSDGWRKNYLAKSEIEARRVDSILRKAHIPAKVLPIIAISGARKVKIKRPPHWHGRNIGVARVEDVSRRLLRRQSRLRQDEVDSIAAVLSDSGNWAVGEPVTDGLFSEFARIDRGVARFRNLIISTAFVLVIVSDVVAGYWFSLTLVPGIADYISSLYT